MNGFDLIGAHIGEIDTMIDDWISQLGLGYNHFAVLHTLASSPDGQCTQKQICQAYYLPKQTVFNVCKEYKEKGWIDFQPSPQDKRERLMQLTELGKQQAEPIVRRTNQLFDGALAQFGAEKSALLFSLMSEFCQVCYAQMDKLKEG
ncbi:DNA-binding protein [Pasteurellaceae bacterium RH1A]|nr:DNA-binding protein [Pasteurellaceae bacterium RH1A]